MKIISKFRDCYDSVLGMGRDETIIYHRLTKEIKDDVSKEYVEKIFKTIPHDDRYYNYNNIAYHFKPYIFFICGKNYILYHFKYNDTEVFPRPDVDKYLYSFDDVQTEVEKYNFCWMTKERFYYRPEWNLCEFRKDNLKRINQNKNSLAIFHNFYSV